MKVEIRVGEGSFNMFERGTQTTNRLETGNDGKLINTKHLLLHEHDEIVLVN